ncbi:ABC transporter ATP-binding protein, partial [bacterium]|nr:ABC transporter ATP-binding protein [bacterium]
LDNFSVKFSTPQCVAICGENGVGKTTLAKLLAGILRPQKGSIKVKGQDITKLPLHLVAPIISFVPVNAQKQILSPTIKGEIAFAPKCQGRTSKEVESTVKELLELTGLDQHVSSNPYELSTCNLYLLSIAAVLALKAPIVIFDEPTLHADLPFMRTFLDIIEYLLKKDTLVIVISHDKEFIDLACKQTLLLN